MDDNKNTTSFSQQVCSVLHHHDPTTNKVVTYIYKTVFCTSPPSPQ
uniref:Uncharacterized protein n=1 Tax=Nelumbo nucifera TaxID=4432 RepID=A0A822YTB3_NELNU|nr:TPA_asm: hypothetical protein HUJ06_004995 [Nelumbo nucifera]